MVAGGISSALLHLGMKKPRPWVGALIYLFLVALFVLAAVFGVVALGRAALGSASENDPLDTAQPSTPTVFQTNEASSTGIQVVGDHNTVYSDTDLKNRFNFKTWNSIPLLKDE